MPGLSHLRNCILWLLVVILLACPVAAQDGAGESSFSDSEPIQQRGRLWKREWLITYLDAGATDAECSVRVSPSMLPLLVDDWSRWQDAPLYAMDQAAARLIAAGSLLCALSREGGGDPGVVSDLRAEVVRTGSYLLARQNPDGGWGWWPGDQSRALHTALAFRALLMAGAGSAPIDRRSFAGAANFLDRALASTNEPELEAIVVHSLALAGRDVSARARALQGLRDRLSAPGLALVADALSHNGALYPPERDLVVTELVRRAGQTASFASWDAADTRGRLPEGSVYATAAIVETLIEWGEQNGIGGKGIEFLLRTPPDMPGVPSIATGQYIAALALAAQVQKQQTQGLLRIGLEGVPMMEEPIDDGLEVHEVRFTELRPGSNWIEILLEGDGPLYFTSSLARRLRDRGLPAARSSDGFVVQRAYMNVRGRDWTFRYNRGDYLLVRLSVMADREAHHVVLTDEIPEGCRFVPESVTWDGLTLSKAETSADGTGVTFRVPILPSGEHWIAYLLRAEAPNRVRVLPATARLNFRPSVWGRSSETQLTIDP